MIAKSLIFFLLLTILPDVYLWYRYFRKRRWWQQLLWFLPLFILMVATVLLARDRDFVPDVMTWLNVYLLAFALTVVPKTTFSLCSLCGRKGWIVGLFTIPVVWYVVLVGSFVDNKKFEVRHVELSFDDLPEAFDDYRIVQFSDIHVGSIDSLLLCRAIDSINAQQADLVVFTGDIQNKQPSEIHRFQDTLSAIRAHDGVISVMGNHDYPIYVDVSPEQKYINEQMTIGIQQDMGWNLLVNGHHTIRRDSAAIVIGGMDNDGAGRLPQRGNINTTLWGVDRQAFIVMLEHDPSSWRRKILHAQLTLSGHTHGMQFSLFGWSPLRLFKRECDGLYQVGNRYLYVSKGIGGVVPFRFGAIPEIVVITLKCSSLHRSAPVEK